MYYGTGYELHLNNDDRTHTHIYRGEKRRSPGIEEDNKKKYKRKADSDSTGTTDFVFTGDGGDHAHLRQEWVKCWIWMDVHDLFRDERVRPKTKPT